MRRRDFERVVAQALAGLPRRVRERLENIAVVVEDLPGEDVLEEMGIQDPHDLLGLYQGISLDRRGFYYGNVLPDKISLYQKAIESQCDSRKAMVRTIQEVVLHEIGHYFGLDDAQLQELLDEEEGGCE
jgi:predicted Zn-dependent protease with MMP-like domain